MLTGYLSNYTMITEMIRNIINQMFSSLQATLGNYIHTHESKQQAQEMSDNYLFICYFIGNFCMVCITLLIQPFIGLFFGENLLLDDSTAIFLGINLLLSIILIVPSQLFIIYRLYSHEKIIIMLGAGLNIVISIALVQTVGVNGVLIGTFITSLIYIFARLIILSNNIFHVTFYYYIKKLMRYFIVSALIYNITLSMTNTISGETILSFLSRSIAVAVIVIIISICFFCDLPEYRFAFNKVCLLLPYSTIIKKIEARTQIFFKAAKYILFIIGTVIILNSIRI